MNEWILIPIVLFGGYYSTTLVLWFSHWFAHIPRSPLRGFHVLGHHAIYPSGQECLGKRFIYGTGRHDSIYIFLPWIAAETFAIWQFLTIEFALLVTIEAAFLVWGFSYLHEQFHLINSRHQNSLRFLNARKHHFKHHDENVNFSVLDHFWDRVFGTAS